MGATTAVAATHTQKGAIRQEGLVRGEYAFGDGAAVGKSIRRLLKAISFVENTELTAQPPAPTTFVLLRNVPSGVNLPTAN